MKTILLIDTDLGFVFWLGQILDGAGFEALPAKSVPDALPLLAELKSSVALLIVNPSLPGASDLMAKLSAANKDLRIITLAGEDEPKPGQANERGRRRKPQEFDESTRAEWLEIVRAAFELKACA